MNKKNIFIGEFSGTFILVLFGCGSVAVTKLFGAHNSLYQVAAIWGFAVALAIYTTRHLSGAHLNPAVTISMYLIKRMKSYELPIYLSAQLLGAFFAALILYLLFSPSIAHYEWGHHIIRGEANSIETAMIFGEFYPNPGNGVDIKVSLMSAILAELIGTGLLVFFILSLTDSSNAGKPDSNSAPVFIGGTVFVIICIIAPLTQAGLNPARDFGPRIFSYLAGWGEAAFPDNQFGFFFVYILGPILGGAIASFIYSLVYKPAMEGKDLKYVENNERIN